MHIFLVIIFLFKEKEKKIILFFCQCENKEPEIAFDEGGKNIEAFGKSVDRENIYIYIYTTE